jgi:hypothetical protein
MTFARLGRATHAEYRDIRPPFSNFQFVDALLPGGEYNAVRRLFSLARREGGQTLILEDIDAAGAVEDEIAELEMLFPGYRCGGLKRLSFWAQCCPAWPQNALLTDSDLLGYAIIKHDSIPGEFSRWHIFESVFRKYPHEHNCVPGEPSFDVRCVDRTFHVSGIMYCQQNGLNKACAQVALRSLLSRITPDRDILYSEMNEVARRLEPGFAPAAGLDTNQIRAILEFYEIKYDDLDYMAADTAFLPYSRMLYAGIENGLGGLMGFELSGPDAEGQKHIIPFYGHTFNRDTWVPRASLAYFHVGDNTRYISSEEWTSSFIGHDDNFGANYCMPRRFLEPGQVKYVVALRPREAEYGTIEAEAIAVDCLYATFNALKRDESYWIRRLIVHIHEQDVVLRTVYVERSQYVAHLRHSQDWNGNSEDTDILETFSDKLPGHLWMIEVSIPELFPANYRKLGEILLDACVPLNPYPHREALWVMARFPGSYLINNDPEPQSASFSTLRSGFDSHISLYLHPNSRSAP